MAFALSLPKNTTLTTLDGFKDVNSFCKSSFVELVGVFCTRLLTRAEIVCLHVLHSHI